MRLWALTLTSPWIECLPAWTLQNFRASTLTGFWIENLCWVGTVTNLIGALAFARVLVEY